MASELEAGPVLKFARRVSAINYQIQNPNSTIPQQQRYKFKIGVKAMIASSLITAFHTLRLTKLTRQKKMDDVYKLLKYGKYINLGVLGIIGFVVHQTYTIYTSIPQSRFLQIQHIQHKQFLQMRQKYRKDNVNKQN